MFFLFSNFYRSFRKYIEPNICKRKLNPFYFNIIYFLLTKFRFYNNLLFHKFLGELVVNITCIVYLKKEILFEWKEKFK